MAFGDDMEREEFSLLSEVLEERARAIPGVAKVASAEMLPLGISYQETNWDIPGVEPPSGEDHLSIPYNTVSRDYFDVMGIPMV